MNFNKKIEAVPEKYRKEIDGGKIERIEYEAATEEGSFKKHAYVYLPKGYTKEEKYDVFYFLHGGGDNAESYFYGEGREGLLKNMLDGMISDGLIRPVIVVTPTFYTGTDDGTIPSAHDHVAKFHKELVNELMACIEKNYSTYEEREHRLFGGFSMGSACTWYVFMTCLEHFKYFLPISGDCWCVCPYGGKNAAKETAHALKEAVKKSEYKDDFFIYAVTGTNDVAYEAMECMCREMEKEEEFDFSGNILFNVKEGGIHRYESVEEYVLAALPLIFPKN